jgi:D-serine deaminase-like pyridoxal phosphate-dependent protein
MKAELDRVRDELKKRYSDQIGRPRSEVRTPALLLDLDLARQNIALMAAKFRSLPSSLRPHIKAHKSPELALMEVRAGAIGVACATVWEAIVMAEAGIRDVLVANEVVHPDKVQALAAAAREHRLTVAVEDERNVAALEEAAGRNGSQLEILVEVDVGMGRCGVRDPEAALRVAKSVAASRHLRFRGLQGYEGHCMHEPDRSVREREAAAANSKLVQVVTHLSGNGLAPEVVSAGGTGTYYTTGASPHVTEVQAGAYSVMDCRHERLVPSTFQIALTVLATVVSRQGRTIVLDAGRKSVSTEFVPPPLAHGLGGEVRYYAEEHTLIDFAGTPPVDVGDAVELYTGYAATAVNLYDVYHVIEDGVVTDIWPITPRGSGPPA